MSGNETSCIYTVTYKTQQQLGGVEEQCNVYGSLVPRYEATLTDEASNPS